MAIITDTDEFFEKILLGVKKASYKLAQKSAANNEELVISDKEGNIKSVPAKELLKTLPDPYAEDQL